MVSIPIRNEAGPSPHAGFRATPGSRIKDEDARLIGTVVTEIILEKGDIQPADVVEAATPEDAPLHRYFTWDNDLAARQYRLDQARRLLRSVQVQIEYRAPDGSPGRAWTRSFQNVRVPGRGDAVDGMNPPMRRVYVPITYARSQPQLMAQIVKDAAKYLWAWHAKYRQYAAIEEFTATFGPLFAALDAMQNPTIVDDDESDAEALADDPVSSLSEESDSDAVDGDDDEPPMPTLP